MNCGTFSYAEIPQKLDSILGVTGTLQTPLMVEGEILAKAYGICKYTYIPSLFGESKFRFNAQQDIILSDTSYFNEALKEEIRKRLTDRNEKVHVVYLYFLKICKN